MGTRPLSIYLKNFGNQATHMKTESTCKYAADRNVAKEVAPAKRIAVKSLEFSEKDAKV